MQLKDLAEGRGAHALGVAVSARKLVRMALPAVVHDGGSGFVAVLDFTEDGLRVLRPSRGLAILTEEEFEKQYGQTVRALLVSGEPLSLSKLGLESSGKVAATGSEPRLRLERSMIPVGRIYTHGWQERLTLHNDGDGELRIREVRALCPGIEATVAATTLHPGESTRLHVSGSQSQPGGFGCVVQVTTDHPSTAQVKIPVHGYLELPVYLDRPSLVLQKVLTGRRVEAEVGLDLADGFDPRRVRVEVPKGAPVAVEVRPDGEGDHRLLVKWLGAASPGWHRYRLAVRPGEGEAFAATPLLLAVEVVPPVEMFPPSIVVGDAEIEETWSRKITFRFHERGDPRFTVTTPETQVLERLRLEMLESNAKSVTVALTPAREGRLRQVLGKKADLVFRFSAGEAVVSVYVGERALRTGSRANTAPRGKDRVGE